MPQDDKTRLVSLCLGMLVFGAANTLITKAQDRICIANCDAPNEADRQTFESPLLQTGIMFLGESLCAVAAAAASLRARWKRVVVPVAAADGGVEDPSVVDSPNGRPRWAALAFVGPASLDICATTLINAGLSLTAASIAQMTRGAIVFWVAFLSVVFLGRRLAPAKWLALAVVILGIAMVGLAGIWDDDGAGGAGGDGADEREVTLGSSTLLAVLLISLSQLFQACQFVAEEAIMHNVAFEPLESVGYEGMAGLGMTVLASTVVYLVLGRDSSGGNGTIFDTLGSLRLILYTPALLSTSLATALSIALFNFFGLSVTRRLSATSRSTIDTCRTLLIWLTSLALGWEAFSLIQLAGFGLLVYGTLAFNDVVQLTFWAAPRSVRLAEARSHVDEEHAPLAGALLPENDDDRNA